MPQRALRQTSVPSAQSPLGVEGAMALSLIRTFDRVVGMCAASLTELKPRRRSGRNAREGEAQMFAQRISRRIIPLAVTCVAVIGTATSAASDETISIASQTATKLIAEDGHTVTREGTAEFADGVSLSTSAETVKVSDKASTDGSFSIAQTQGMNRRADRRDTRQDCRHQEGAVGADKRNCKQQRRQTRGSSPPG